MVAHSEALAGECAPPTPECHLANGTKLLTADPKRAASELLASFQLDERTDTLALYATALQADRQYARALDTWQRIILFRESEIEAAKEAMRGRSSRKREAARAAQARAQEQSELASAEIIKLWASVGRVRVVFSPGQQLVVSDDGVELDASKDFLVNAGRDELTFTRPDGSAVRVVVEVAAGQIKTVEAPKERGRVEAPIVTPPPAPPALAEPKPTSVVATRAPALAAARFVDAPRSPMLSRVGLGLVAGGAIGFGIAGTLGYLASRDFDRARELGCNSDGQCPIGPAADLGGQSRDRSRLAQITAVGGGALLVTGATLWILGRGTTRRAATEVTVSVSPSSVGIGWSLQ
jgi:hypothetical protein